MEPCRSLRLRRTKVQNFPINVFINIDGSSAIQRLIFELFARGAAGAPHATGNFINQSLRKLNLILLPAWRQSSSQPASPSPEDAKILRFIAFLWLVDFHRMWNCVFYSFDCNVCVDVQLAVGCISTKMHCSSYLSTVQWPWKSICVHRLTNFLSSLVAQINAGGT